MGLPSDPAKRSKVIFGAVFEILRVPLLISIFVVGCVLVNKLADEDMRYFEKKDDWTGERCLVLLSPKTLEGDVIQLISLESANQQPLANLTTGITAAPGKNVDNSCGLANNGVCDEPNLCPTGTDCWDCQTCAGLKLPGNVQVDVPKNFDVKGAQVFHSEACDLVLKEDAKAGKHSFHKTSKDFPAMVFPACPTYANETATHAAQVREVSRQLYGYDLKPSSMTAIGAGVLLLWFFLKIFGIVTGFINIFQPGYDIIVNCGEDDGACGAGLYEFTRYCIYSLAPGCLLAPFASLKVHDECPQIATMQMDDSTSWSFAAGAAFVVILLVFTILRPCSPNDQVDKAMCDRKGGTWRVVVFLVICANIVGFAMFFVGMAVFAQMNVPALFFDLSGLFTWPDYTISMSADLIRLFLGILIALEFFGMLKMVGGQIIKRFYKGKGDQ